MLLKEIITSSMLLLDNKIKQPEHTHRNEQIFFIVILVLKCIHI
jgi:hypothetical protein